MRPAEERRSASTMTMTSIRLSLVGWQVDCNTNTSRPRTFSRISRLISPSEKRPTSARPKGMPRLLVTSSANAVLALPVNTIMLLVVDTCILLKLEKRVNQLIYTLLAVETWLGRKDSNLRMHGSKPCALTNLATPQ